MCTRVFNNRNSHLLTTGRTMDWASRMDTSMFYFPAHLKKTGLESDTESELPPVTWESQFSSVVAMVSGHASSDGINRAGLVANVLYQSESRYAKNDQLEGKEGLSALRWVQFVLDQFDKVSEVVKCFEKADFVIVPAMVPDEGDEPKEALLHLSVSDLEGNSAIIEVVRGKYKIHQSPDYRVMTNDPLFSKQLQLNKYWEWQWDTERNKHPTDTLPGSAFSPDRFARADYYVNKVRDVADEPAASAQMMSILNAASVPLDYEPSADEPNISQTLWFTVASHKLLRYYFRDAFVPNTFWTDLGKTELFPEIKPGFDCLTLPTRSADGQYIHYAGMANSRYIQANDPFAR